MKLTYQKQSIHVNLWAAGIYTGILGLTILWNQPISIPCFVGIFLSGGLLSMLLHFTGRTLADLTNQTSCRHDIG